MNVIITKIQENLSIVESGFNKTISEMEPLTQTLLSTPKYFLSRLLIGTISRGSKQFDERNLRACLALEFLEQALDLAEFASGSQKYSEDSLLVSDYLYAQAINQVIEVNEPEIIKALALTIAKSAEDKAAGAINSTRQHLVVAVFDISLVLGDFTDAVSEDICSLRAASMIKDPEEWLRMLPAGPLRDDLVSSISVGIRN